MNVIIKKASTLQELKQEIDNHDVNSLLPSINELINVVEFKNIEPIIYHIRHNHKTIGATVLFKQRRKIHGFSLNTLSIVGSDFYDYNFFFCDEEYFDQFVDYITKDAKKYKVDLIALDNILFPSKSKRERKELVYIFDTKLSNKEKRFCELLEKKSLVRHHKKATKLLDYSCENKVSQFVENDIKDLAEIHKERWDYDDIKSGFYSPERVGLYSAHRNNKMLTVLKNGNDIIASHYGIILGDTFLWHTPAINVKYLAYSPVEILLFEIIKFCNEKKITVLDLGLGNEEYKARFSNTTRPVYHRISPVSFNGKMSHILINNVNTSFVKLIANKSMYYAKKNYHSIRRLGKNILYYKFSGVFNESYIVNKFQNCHFCVVTEFEKLVDIFRKNKIPIKKYQYNRIRSGNILFCLIRDQELLCYGWNTRQDSFHVSEINRLLNNKNKVMLYDFFTPEKLRGHGYYTALLIKICAALSSEEIVIFAEQKNHASNKAIKRAGFSINPYQVITDKSV